MSGFAANNRHQVQFFWTLVHHVKATSTHAGTIPALAGWNRNGRPSFSHELRALAERFDGKPTCIRDILEATNGRGFDLLLVCLTLPFVTPIPLPGLSAPFGLVVLLIGARLALGQKPWLPRGLLKRELPAKFLGIVLSGALRVTRALEFLLKPRLHFVHESLVFRRVAGSLIMFSGFLLLLPVPLPFCNSLPALTVLLLAAAALERDGVVLLAGAACFVLSLGYFCFLGFGGAHLVDSLMRGFLGS